LNDTGIGVATSYDCLIQVSYNFRHWQRSKREVNIKKAASELSGNGCCLSYYSNCCRQVRSRLCASTAESIYGFALGLLSAWFASFVSVLGSGLSILILYQYVFAFVCVHVSCVALVCRRVFSCVATRMCFALMPGLYLCTLVCTDCCIKRVRFRTYLLYDSVMLFASYYDMNLYPTCTTSYKPRIPVIRLWPLPSSLTPPECLRQRLLSY
jgi:hypothetical protein